jgi:hypothetical protein
LPSIWKQTLNGGGFTRRRDELTLVRHLCALGELLRDLRHTDWRERRAVRRDLDQRLAAWRALPPEDQIGFIHPASPRKPPGWTAEQFLNTRRRRDDAS